MSRPDSWRATIEATARWAEDCWVNDGSAFSADALWTPALIEEVQRAFVDHPDDSTDDFMTKLKGQMRTASAGAQRLMAEMLFALLLFPSNQHAQTGPTAQPDSLRASGHREDALVA